MTKRIVSMFPIFDECVHAIRDFQFMILYAPSHFGKRLLIDPLQESFFIPNNTAVVTLDCLPDGATKKLDFTKLWASTKKQIGSKATGLVRDRVEFRTKVEALVRSRKSKTAFIFKGGNSPTGEELFEVVDLFHSIINDLPLQIRKKLFVVVLDNYALYSQELWQTQNSSRWSFFERVYWGSLDTSDLIKVIEGLRHDTAVDPMTSSSEIVAKEIIALTGGHPGFVVVALNTLFHLRSATKKSQWFNEIRRAILGSHAADSIRRSLAEEPMGLSSTALDLLEPDYPADELSPRIQLLRRLGVIRWISAAKAELCPGIITDIVRSIAKASPKQKPIGRIVTEIGPKRFKAGAVEVEDDDFIALHLSDFHVGTGYRFRIAKVPALDDLSKPEAGKLIREDLESLGLLGRVDIVIASGDFTQGATIEEFRGARYALDEILEAIGLGWDRVAILAGNHDLSWSPGALSTSTSSNGSGRDGFETFRELIGRSGDGLAEVVSVDSRSERRRLLTVSLDSNFVEGPGASGIGYIPQSVLSRADKLLKKTLPLSKKKECVVWLAMHHHVFPASSLAASKAEERNVTLLANVPTVLTYAAKWGAELIAHGHEHQPSVTVARRWPSDVGSSFEPIVSVGAGSLGAERTTLGPFSKNHYFIIHRKKDELIIRSRRMGDGGVAFISHDDMSVPL